MLARDFEIKVITLGGDPLSDAETFVIPRRARLSYLTQAGNASGQAIKFKPDLVHAHYAVGFGYWAMRTGFHPSLLSVWGADVIDFPSNPVKRYLIRKVLRNADHSHGYSVRSQYPRFGGRVSGFTAGEALLHQGALQEVRAEYTPAGNGCGGQGDPRYKTVHGRLRRDDGIAQADGG
jgi:hypothetical protein